MTIETRSANAQLDELLEDVCIALQLSDARHEQAEERYETIGKLLAEARTLLAPYQPRISPQGSMRHRTIVKPWGSDEHDVDLVCLLQLSPQLYSDPLTVYEMVERRLQQSGRYEGKLERFKRCIRINYANEFHLDITPACPDRNRGGTCILVPDRKIREWKESNPEGFAVWFECQTRRAKKAFAERHVQPLPAREPAQRKAPLRRAVQLWKRHRDVVFEGSELAPRSIALTTLAGHHYNGEELVTDSVLGILDNVITYIESKSGSVIEIPNPTNPPEKFCEAWAGDPDAYGAFVNFMYDFRAKFRELLDRAGFDNIARGLDELFGESVSRKAVAAYTERMSRARETKQVHFSSAMAGLTAAAQASRPIPKNNFYGR